MPELSNVKYLLILLSDFNLFIFSMYYKLLYLPYLNADINSNPLKLDHTIPGSSICKANNNIDKKVVGLTNDP